jgi:hypothetical protein
MLLILLLLVLIPLQFWFGMFLANKHTRRMNMKAQNNTKYKWNRRCRSNLDCQIGQKYCVNEKWGQVENLIALQSPRRNQCMIFRWIRNGGNNRGRQKASRHFSVTLIGQVVA